MTKVETYYRNNTLLERLVGSKSFWIAILIFLFFYPVYRSLNRELPPDLPKLYKVPDFSLVNEFGKNFGSKELLGRYYVANFMFTNCPSTCPALMEKMKVIQKRVRGLGRKIAIVSFTVDPDNDRPKHLFKHARDLKANPHIWTFLTGEYEEVNSLLVKGMKVPMGKAEEIKGQVGTNEVTLIDIAHTEKVVLVDDQGMIRGYYSTDKFGIQKLMIDLGLLVNKNILNKKG